MTQPFADALSWVPKSRALGASLTRAHDMTRAQGHSTVRLEHLLLALIEDPDASAVMLACHVDLLQLNGTVTSHLQSFPSGEPIMPVADAALVRILEYAVAAARQSGRGEVNGAIVLAAVVGEGNSEAAQILKQHGLTFQDTVRALQRSTAARAAGTAGPPGVPPAARPHHPAAQPARPTGSGPAAPGPVQSSHGQFASAPASRAEPPASRPSLSDQLGAGAVGSVGSTTALAEARRRIEAMRVSPSSVNLPAGTTSPPTLEPPPPDANGDAAPQMAEPAARRSDRSGERGAAGGYVAEPQSGTASASAPIDAPYPQVRPASSLQEALSGPRAATWAPPARPPVGADVGAGTGRRMPPPVPPLNTPPASGPLGGPPPLPSQKAASSERAEPRGRSEPPPWAGKAPPIERQGAASDGRLDPISPPAPFEPGRLLQYLPTRLWVLASTVVEVKLPRSAVFSIEAAGALPGQPGPQGLAMPRALTMRLRSQTGNSYVETAAPETQFFNARAAYGEDDDVRWRWVVTAKRKGNETLALAVSMRSIGPDGVAIETRLPEQTAVVAIGINFRRMTRSAAVWGAALLIAGLVVLLLSGAWPLLAAAAGRLFG